MRVEKLLKLALLCGVLPALLIASGAESPARPDFVSERLEPAKAKPSTDRVLKAVYKTNKGTDIGSSPGGSVMRRVPAGYVLGASKVTAKHGFTRVLFAGKTGWVKSEDLKKVENRAHLSPDRGSYTASEFAEALSTHAIRWCPGVKVLATDDSRYFATSSPLLISFGREQIRDPYSDQAKSIMLHECAHILQYKAYGIDERLRSQINSPRLKKDVELANPKKDGMGIEYLADCMSELMGAVREGLDIDGSIYQAGYGMKCNEAQYDAARVILSGRMLS